MTEPNNPISFSRPIRTAGSTVFKLGAERLRPTRILAAVVLAALAFFYGGGLHPIWWLAWIAPLPLLLLAPRLSGWTAFGVSWLAAAAGALNLWRYFRQSLESPLALSLVVILLPAALQALGILLFRRFILRGRLIRAAVAFPSFVVACEYIQSVTSPHGTALNLAYSQMNFLPLVQIASVTGLWGITFCILLFPAAVAALISTRGQAGQQKRLAACTIPLFLATLGYGAWRLHPTESGDTVRIGLIASDLPQNTLPTKPEDTLRLLRDYAAKVQQLVSRHPRIVVLPEKIGVVEESDLKEVDGLLAGSAARAGVTLVAGLIRRDRGAYRNEARIYPPEGGPPRTYEKHHMLPPFESQYVPGTSLSFIHDASGTWGVAICKDMDFPPLSRRYAREGTGLLLVPAWDFDIDGWLHGRMAILRGVESGFSIARAPRHGILTLSDSCGRVLAEESSAAAPFATLVAEVTVRHRATVYSVLGDWFAWLCIVTLLMLWGTG